MSEGAMWMAIAVLVMLQLLTYVKRIEAGWPVLWLKKNGLYPSSDVVLHPKWGVLVSYCIEDIVEYFSNPLTRREFARFDGTREDLENCTLIVASLRFYGLAAALAAAEASPRGYGCSGPWVVHYRESHNSPRIDLQIELHANMTEQDLLMHDWSLLRKLRAHARQVAEALRGADQEDVCLAKPKTHKPDDDDDFYDSPANPR